MIDELTEIRKRIKDEISPAAFEYFGVKVRDVLSVTQGEDNSLCGYLQEDNWAGRKCRPAQTF